jgi:hypothetical protein
MASNYPTSLDNFTNPSSGASLSSPSHAGQHSDINDAVEAVEAKLGIGSSPASSAANGAVLTANGSGSTSWTYPGLVFISRTNYTGAAVVNIDNVFTSNFTAYRVIGMTNPSAYLALWKIRFRNGGVDQTGANYQFTSARLYTNNLIDTYNSGATEMQLSNGGLNGFPHLFSFDIYDPKGNTPTVLTFDSSNFESGLAAVRWWSSGGYKANYSHDGFSIYPNSGTWTGSLAVYGYRTS